MNDTFDRWVRESLVWLPERGMGFYPVTEAPYDQDYFQKYQEYAETEMGKAITEARRRLVLKYVRHGLFVDVGIGCGSFVEALYQWNPRARGFDVNPAGVAWLQERKAFLDPREQRVMGASFWDVLEHIPRPEEFLDSISEWVFISVPIFSSAEHVISSRHFRKDEHMWYWTREGLIAWMDANGFDCVEHNTMESLLGREDIGTFVFRRKSPNALTALAQADGTP